jgi:hypothetical protein
MISKAVQGKKLTRSAFAFKFFLPQSPRWMQSVKEH